MTFASNLIRLGLDEAGWGLLLLALVLVLLLSLLLLCCCFDVFSCEGLGKVGEWDDLLPERIIFLFLFCTRFVKRFSLNFAKCAFRSPARSGLNAGGLICTLDFLNFSDLWSLFDLYLRFSMSVLICTPFLI